MPPDKEVAAKFLEHYQARFESQRSIEWSVVYQLFGAAAALGAAYYALDDPGRLKSIPCKVATTAIGASGVLVGVGLYLSFMVQLRLHRLSALMSHYLAVVRESAPDVKAHHLETVPLLHANSYAFAAQAASMLVICSLVGGYIAWAHPDVYRCRGVLSFAVGALLGIALPVVVAALMGCIWNRKTG